MLRNVGHVARAKEEIKMEREIDENVIFPVIPLCVCSAFADSGQRPLNFLHTVLSL